MTRQELRCASVRVPAHYHSYLRNIWVPPRSAVLCSTPNLVLRVRVWERFKRVLPGSAIRFIDVESPSSYLSELMREKRRACLNLRGSEEDLFSSERAVLSPFA